MTQVTLEDMQKLPERNLSEHLLVCDKSGQVVGHYLPVDAYNRLVCQWAGSQVTTEELRRRMEEKGGRTLSEIWADLRNS